MLVCREKYSPGCKTYPPNLREIRWDVVGCNLRCQFCWSPASRYRETGDPTVIVQDDQAVAQTGRLVENPDRTFLRFTGGEPTLFAWDEVEYVTKCLGQDERLARVPILIQTNGIRIGEGKAPIDWLITRDNQRFLFEVSFKGTNAAEFELLTGKSAELYDQQFAGYDLLNDLAQTSGHVGVVAVLGVYHSAVDSTSQFTFVDPTNGSLLFDDVELWDPRFKDVWGSARFKWVEPLRRSPQGLWQRVLDRCGSQGSGIIAESPAGVATNQQRQFPAKPKSADYASQLVNLQFWD